jgi:hypothetical protein
MSNKWCGSTGYSIPITDENLYKAPAFSGGIAYEL